jgi:hypothetical protein
VFHDFSDSQELRAQLDACLRSGPDVKFETDLVVPSDETDDPSFFGEPRRVTDGQNALPANESEHVGKATPERRISSFVKTKTADAVLFSD